MDLRSRSDRLAIVLVVIVVISALSRSRPASAELSPVCPANTGTVRVFTMTQSPTRAGRIAARDRLLVWQVPALAPSARLAATPSDQAIACA